MKNFLSIFVIASVVLLGGCSSGDEPINVPIAKEGDPALAPPGIKTQGVGAAGGTAAPAGGAAQKPSTE